MFGMHLVLIVIGNTKSIDILRHFLFENLKWHYYDSQYFILTLLMLPLGLPQGDGAVDIEYKGPAILRGPWKYIFNF